MALIEIADLSASYRKIVALNRLGLAVEEGECVALLGANAAGKTTTLNCISGTIDARVSGTVRFDGRDISRVPAHARVELGIVHVPEGRGVFTGMTVLENLDIGAYPRRARAAAAAASARTRVLEMFPRLAERSKQQAGSLSGGEQQMLAVGRALMSRPRLLLLDEPSTGLAPVIVAEVFRAIEEIAREGVAVLIVEQKVDSALRFVDRAYVLARGRVVLTGAAEDVRVDPGLREAYLGRE